MVDARKAAVIMAAIGPRVAGAGIALGFDRAPSADTALPVRAGRVGDPLGRRIEAEGRGDRMLDMVGSTAIIPIEGTLVHKGAYLNALSGETSYEGLQAKITRAGRDDRVKGVVFEVDSFGGEVAGAFETAGMIAALSQAKPTLAILTDFALSAGYLLASAARQIVLPATGAAGSIGVITMHVDYSAALAEEGLKVTVIAAGAHKADGHPAAALADDVRARLQARVDETRDLFAAAVGRFRGRRLSKRAALATEALDYHGAAAVAAGLADGVMDAGEAFTTFTARMARR